MSVSVIGSGAFGTALAISLARIQPVVLWSRNPNQARTMQSDRTNAGRLAGAEFPPDLTATSDVDLAGRNDIILIATPMQQLREALNTLAHALAGKSLVACCKGIELSTGRCPVEILESQVPRCTPAILTGPSFARDIAIGLPTALTLACGDVDAGRRLQLALATPNIRLYRTTDTVGAELGGALKNVMAIACGATIGAGLGDSARAALMTRGYAEMQRMATKFGAHRETLAGLSGFGDLALTCTSDQSRNYQLGLSIGKGIEFDPSVTVEGAATARAVHEIAKSNEIEMPITDVVVQLLDQRTDIRSALATLLARPLKEE